jgi:hypothetical protein
MRESEQEVSDLNSSPIEESQGYNNQEMPAMSEDDGTAGTMEEEDFVRSETIEPSQVQEHSI